MRPVVRAAFAGINGKWEGVCSWMYADIKNLVTTGIGNLIDPIELALGLPFQVGEYAATRAEIETEWNLVKSRTDLTQRGGGAYKAITKLRLTPEGIERLVLSKLDANAAYLTRRFPQFDEWPADAQCGVLSWAWAVGPAAGYPKFATALVHMDFDAAAAECHIDDTHNPGVKPRNVANVIMFKNAAVVVERGLPIDRLYFPLDLKDDTLPDEPGTDRIAKMGDFRLDVPYSQHVEGIFDLDREPDPEGNT